MAITINGDGLIDVGGTSTTQGRVRLAEDSDNGTNYIELTAPASVSANRTITFPDVTGTVLTNATTTGFPAGSVLQVVQSNQFNGVTTTSGSAQFSSTNPSITPSATSSKILLFWATSVIVDCDADSQGSNNGFVRFEFQIGGTGGAWSLLGQFSVPGRGGNGTFTNAVFLQSPATTSAVYYRMGIGKEEGARNILINDAWGSNRLFMLEIAG